MVCTNSTPGSSPSSASQRASGAPVQFETSNPRRLYTALAARRAASARKARRVPWIGADVNHTRSTTLHTPTMASAIDDTVNVGVWAGSVKYSAMPATVVSAPNTTVFDWYQGFGSVGSVGI